MGKESVMLTRKDMAMEYNAKLMEVDDNIKQLEELRIPADNFRKIVDGIDDGLNEKVKECEAKSEEGTSELFGEDLLVKAYSDAKGKLDKANEKVCSVYDEYYKILSKCEVLSQKIDQLELANLQDIAQDTLQLLNALKHSSTMNYVKEKFIIDKVYELAYKVIKRELIYTNRSRILESARTDEVDLSYLVKLIKEEIESLHNKELLNKINEINTKGLRDVHYLDEELINMISVIKKETFIKPVEDKIVEQIDSCIVTSNSLCDSRSFYITTQEEINEIIEKNKQIARKRFGKRILLYVNMGVVGAFMAGSIKLCKELTSVDMYKTVTITYDTNTSEDEITTEYLPSIKDSIKITEYSPWEASGYFRDEYKRNVYTYDLSNVDVLFDQPEDYLTTDIKDSIGITTTVETSSEIPKDMYVENRYLVTQTATATMTYDTETLESDTTIAYIPSNGNHVELIEYSPWEAPGYFRDEYTRNVYTYDLSNVGVEFDQPKDYLTSDIKDSINVTATVETSSEMPNDIIENRYVVTKVTQDKTISYKEDRPVWWGFASFFCSLGIVLVDTLLLKKLSKTTLQKLKLQKKENKFQLEQKNQLLLETNAQINELTNQLNMQRTELELDYAKLPSALQQTDKVKKMMRSYNESTKETLVPWKNS